MSKKIFSQLNKVLLVRFAGTFGSEMLQFAISLYILQRTGSALSMGMSLITGPLVALCIMPFVGYVVDTYSHKTIMIISQIITIMSLLLFGLFLKLWPEEYLYSLIGLIIVLEATDTFLSTTIQSSLIQLFSKDELQKVNSLSQSISSLAEFLAPILGAMLYTLISIDMFANLEIIFELVALFGIGYLKFNRDNFKSGDKVIESNYRDTKKIRSLISNFLDGFRYLSQQKLILTLTLSSALLNFFFAALNIGFPYLLVKILGLSNVQYGLTDSAMAVGMVIGGIVLSKIHLRLHPVITSYLTLLIFSFVLAMIGVFSIFNISKIFITGIFVLINVLNGLLLVFINTPLDTFLQETVPPNIQGRIFNFDETLSTILMPAGTIFFGLLFDNYNIIVVFIIAGAAVSLLAILTLSIIKKRDYLILDK